MLKNICGEGGCFNSEGEPSSIMHRAFFKMSKEFRRMKGMANCFLVISLPQDKAKLDNGVSE